MSTVLQILHEDGYCCCGEDHGQPVIATFCPKHGCTVLNVGNRLEYPMDDEHQAMHQKITGCTYRQAAGDSLECPKHTDHRLWAGDQRVTVEVETSDDNDDETVDLIVSGYEWDCPNCEAGNKTIEVTEKVTCYDCGKTYATNPPDHAYE